MSKQCSHCVKLSYVVNCVSHTHTHTHPFIYMLWFSCKIKILLDSWRLWANTLVELVTKLKLNCLPASNSIIKAPITLHPHHIVIVQINRGIPCVVQMYGQRLTTIDTRNPTEAAHTSICSSTQQRMCLLRSTIIRATLLYVCKTNYTHTHLPISDR